MADPLHEVVYDLAPPLTVEGGRRYRAMVVGTVAADGHWNATTLTECLRSCRVASGVVLQLLARWRRNRDESASGAE